MSFIKWSDKYSVQVKKFDGAHQKLIDLMNALHDAMSAGKGNSIIKDIIKSLREYTEYHFDDEIALLEKYSYPDLDIHKRLHKEFVDRLKEFEQGAQEGKLLLSIEILTFLRDWLIHHIGEVDKNYSNFLHENGVQ